MSVDAEVTRATAGPTQSVSIHSQGYNVVGGDDEEDVDVDRIHNHQGA